MKVIYAIGTAMTMTLGLLLMPVHAAAPTTPVATSTTVQVTTTTSTTSTTIAPMVSVVPDDINKRCPDLEPTLREYGLRPVAVFSYIAWRESRCDVTAINAKWNSAGEIVWTLNRDGSYDSGLLQINSTWKSVTRRICGGDISMLMSLDCNLRVAKYLLDNGGLSHWSMSLNP